MTWPIDAVIRCNGIPSKDLYMHIHGVGCMAHPRVGFDQGCLILVAIEVLLERMAAGFVDTGINDFIGQLH